MRGQKGTNRPRLRSELQFLSQPSAAHDLMVCRALSRLVACYFQHVDVDESAMPALWAHFADPELAKARAAALAAHKPVTVLANLTNMLRAASWQERARFLTGLKRGMPPPVFAGVRERLGALVEPSVWLSVDEAA